MGGLIIPRADLSRPARGLTLVIEGGGVCLFAFGSSPGINVAIKTIWPSLFILFFLLLKMIHFFVFEMAKFIPVSILCRHLIFCLTSHLG